MAGIQPESDLRSHLGGLDVALQYRLHILAVGKGAGVTLRVKLDAIGAGLGRETDLFRVRVHEQAGANTQGPEFLYQGGNHVTVALEVEAVVGGELVVAIRDQGALGRADLPHQGHEPRVVADALPVALARAGHGVAFDIEFHVQHGGQVVAVLHPDVALVRPRVHGDAVGAGVETDLRVARDIRIAGVPGIANQGDLVEVYTEGGHSSDLRTISLMTIGSIGTSLKPFTVCTGLEAM